MTLSSSEEGRYESRTGDNLEAEHSTDTLPLERGKEGHHGLYLNSSSSTKQIGSFPTRMDDTVSFVNQEQ